MRAGAFFEHNDALCKRPRPLSCICSWQWCGFWSVSGFLCSVAWKTNINCVLLLAKGGHFLASVPHCSDSARCYFRDPDVVEAYQPASWTFWPHTICDVLHFPSSLLSSSDTSRFVILSSPALCSQANYLWAFSCSRVIEPVICCTCYAASIMSADCCVSVLQHALMMRFVCIHNIYSFQVSSAFERLGSQWEYDAF